MKPLTAISHRVGKKLGRSSEKLRKPNLHLESLEVREVPAAYAFDFDTATTTAATGYTHAPLSAYTATEGFGWQSITGMQAVNRSAGTALTSDIHLGTDSTFKVDVANGDYDVVATLGDAKSARDRVSVWAEGKQLVSSLTTSSGQFLEVRGRVTVSDGQFALRLADSGGSNKQFAIAALKLTSVDAGATSLFGTAAPPAQTATSDTNAVELGMKFQTAVDGFVTGVRFHKAVGNTGTHVGTLWTSSGQKLASVTFANETASGWQEAKFSSPVAVKAGTTYVVSYQAPKGSYSYSYDYFKASGVSNGSLTAPGGSNGVFTYGSGSVPNQTYKNTNYWVDFTFAPNATTPAPTANAGVDKSGNEGSSVSFAGSATGTGLSYAWDFGDGKGKATTATPSYTYTDNGTFTATLTVTDSLGRKATDNALVTVSNVAPTATVNDNNPILEGSPVTIFFENAADASSADTTAGFKYSYDFNNDGVWDVVDSTSSSVQTTYTDDGTYTVAMRIKDKDGGFSTYTNLVDIADAAPTATFGNNGPVQVGEAVTFSFTNQKDASSTDTTAGFKYSYDFNNDGTFEVSDSTSASATFTFNTQGTYTTKGRIADKDGAFTDYTTTVTVGTPPAPTANAGVDKSGNEGSSVSFAGSATGTGLSYAWDFGDGKGTAATATPSYTYTDNGTFTATLTVTDSLGRKATDNATVVVSNVAPTATFTAPTSGIVNTAVTFSFSNQQDVSSTDTAAGFKYSYDFNNDGTFEVSNSTNASVANTYTVAGTYTFKGRITDKDGGSTDYSKLITISSAGSGDDQGILRTLYVSPTGSDSNTGSSTSPWKTLQKAADSAKAGDMIVVRAGTYAGFQITTDGTAANRIVFKADSGVTVNAKLASASAYSGAINLEGADYVTIDGFNVTLATYGSVRSNIRSVENTGAVIRNNVIDDASWWGILAGNSENLLIENNRITDTKAQHGIYVANSADNPILRNNYVANSRGAGIQINADKDLPGDGIISGAIVEGNTLLNNCSGESSSLNLNGVEDATIINNLIASQYRNGIAMYQDNQTAGTKNNLVAFNTIIGSAFYGISISGSGSTGNELYNNILFSQGWGSNYRGGLGVENITGLKSDYNILMGRVNRDPSDTESTSETATQWQARGFDTHSIFLESQYSSATAALSALFVTPPSWPLYEPEEGDYRLKVNSPAINAGTAISGVTKDIQGDTRDTTPDIGAYEI